MKIEKIYIGAFGGLKDYTLELNDGLNVIFGENENGKTTVMAFIKMMFYGSGKKVSQISASPRVKYTPWSGDNMCGRIYFEDKNVRYCLEREFRKSDSTDKITLLNLDLGTAETAESDVGLRFFGLTAAAFERSNFVSTPSFTSAEDAAGELGVKLSNLALTGDESVSYQEVLSRITTASEKLISKSGRTGAFVKNDNLLSDLKSELEASQSAAQRKSELTDKINVLKARYNEIKSQYDTAKKTLDSETDIRNAEKLKEYLDTKSELDRLYETLKTEDGKIADESFVKTVKFALNGYEIEKQKADGIENEIEQKKKVLLLSSGSNTEALKSEADGITAKKAELSREKAELENALKEISEILMGNAVKLESSPAKSKPVSLILIILGAIAICFGLVTAFIAKLALPQIISVALGIIMGTVGIIAGQAGKREIKRLQEKQIDIKSREADIKTKLAQNAESDANLSRRLADITAALNTDNAMRERDIADLDAKKEALNEINEKLRIKLEDLLKVFGRYSKTQDIDSIKRELNCLEEKAEVLKEIKQRLAYISRDLGNISYDEAEKKLTAISDNQTENSIDFDALKSRCEKMNDEINAITSEISGILAELKTGFSSFRDPSDIKREINEISDVINRQKAFYDAAQIAGEVLSESFAEVRRSYGSTLESKALSVFSRLTGGRYSTVNISKSLDMSVEQNGIFGTHETDYLSQGTIDQSYLSLRLAMTELISAENPLPIFLDDAFDRFDDKRMCEALSFLKEYGESSQILLFTCHGAICSSAKENGIGVKNL